ncbi:MAG: type II toxin-antitoxin system VapC family toxin [Candidatus Methanoperedens sp.]|nr:type II toxin-antitoxin system VapC family toxin [Candidatus Methanoperedens sp.]
MNTILIDTIYVAGLLMDDSYFELAQSIHNKKITGLASVITITELIKIRGMKENERMNSDLDKLVTSNLIFVDVGRAIAKRAGELRLKYDIPTVDSLIAATGIVENVKHILTDDDHFDSVKNLIKPIDLKTALKLIK